MFCVRRPVRANSTSGRAESAGICTGYAMLCLIGAHSAWRGCRFDGVLARGGCDAWVGAVQVV
jgi:hypothetical protein